MDITILPILEDNYTYLIRTAGGQTIIVDPGESQPVIDYLESKSWSLDIILNTHHHGDHVAGNKDLQDKYGAKIYGPAAEESKIGIFDKSLVNGDHVTIDDLSFEVIETPGHTLGHICFYAAENDVLFCADTLFPMACGRIFEGTFAQMWESLKRLRDLPDQTQCYCGHEYTLSNVEFALQNYPKTDALEKRAAAVTALRESNTPTIPFTIADEKATNAMLNAESLEEFTRLRTLKDNF